MLAPLNLVQLAENPKVKDVLDDISVQVKTTAERLRKLGINTSQNSIVAWREGQYEEPDNVNIAADVDRLKRQLVTTQRQLHDTKHRHADYLETLWEAVTQAIESQVIKPVKVPSNRSVVGKSEVAVALLSDMQTGKLTPTYNTEICAERVNLYADKIIKLAQIQEKDHPVRECVVPMLGDMLENTDIFPGQPWLIDSTLYTQLLDSTPVIIVEFIQKLLTYFDTVRAVCVDGNHGRIGRRGQFGPMDNADRMIYRVVKLMLRNEPRFTLEMTDPQGERNWYRILEIGQYKALLIHGDQIRGHSGFPYYGMCLPSEAEILTRNGWKTNKNLNFGEEVLIFDAETHKNRWESVQDINIFPWSGDLLEVNGIPSTPEHRWPTENSWNGQREIKKTSNLNTYSKIPLHGSYEGCESILSPRLAAILGWVVTDGTARWRGNHWEAGIYQSVGNFLVEIEELTKRTRRKGYAGVHFIPVSIEDRRCITQVYHDKNDLPSLVTQLSREAANAMIEAMYKAEGCVTWSQKKFSQNPGPVAEAYQILSVLTNQTVTISDTEGGILRMCHRKDNYVYPARDGGMVKVPYEGTVWCPTTPSGTWWVRYKGRIMPTGNSKKVQGWGSGGLGADSDFLDVFMGHYHQLARIPLNHKAVYVNGSTESTNTFAQENLAAQSEPMQWLLFVNPDDGFVTAEYGVRLNV